VSFKLLLAFREADSLHSSVANRASASGAGLRVVALEVSVFAAVEPVDFWPEIKACPEANWPPDFRDSAARESEVISPVDSSMVEAGASWV
jgi:hypothetical protein